MLAALLLVLLAAQSLLILSTPCRHAAYNANGVVAASLEANCLHAPDGDQSRREGKDYDHCCFACCTRDADAAVAFAVARIWESILEFHDFEIASGAPAAGPERPLSSAGWVSSWSSQGPPASA
ncbi:hypothetical protein [Methylocystis heyeri]|uniref:DUF2946 domain-containing protein n=1 Tax=Methylocystis heyeri TaxID=391905 RepID=A0A6B8KJD9_9HYPH|nr:hypothetical protein [Methylocystis heyeri]QGM46698.1 hypothetical protein H2LOC_013900 [Methylocystis heyeri]